MSKLKSFSGFIQPIAFHFYLEMSMIFLIALFLLMAQILLESAAETNTPKAFNWPSETSLLHQHLLILPFSS